MLRILFRTVAIVTVGAVFSCFAEQTAVTVPASEAKAAAEQIAADLREARGLLKTVTDKTARERLELLLTRSELRAVDIQKSVAVIVPAPIVIAKPVAISPADFEVLMSALKSKPFDKDKTSFISTLGNLRRFTCAHGRQMLSTFNFDTDRSNAAVALYPLLLDPENFYLVLEAFTFENSRKNLREKLG